VFSRVFYLKGSLLIFCDGGKTIVRPF